MYEAKRQKTDKHVFYKSDYETEDHKNSKLENLLRNALNEDEIEVRYQPAVSARTGDVDHVEALMRWHSTELGPISPSTFIPIAERTGLITDLGNRLFSIVCEDLSKLSDLHASINISSVQLRHPMMVETLVGICDYYGIDRRRIIIELTEGVLSSHPEIARQRISALKEHGFDVVLDDFGTGISGIGNLRELPFDGLKIARDIVSGMSDSREAASQVESIITVGKSLGLSVIPKGVETSEEAELLKPAGCDVQQGFFYSKAVRFSQLDGRIGEGAAHTRFVS